MKRWQEMTNVGGLTPWTVSVGTTPRLEMHASSRICERRRSSSDVARSFCAADWLCLRGSDSAYFGFSATGLCRMPKVNLGELLLFIHTRSGQWAPGPGFLVWSDGMLVL